MNDDEIPRKPVSEWQPITNKLHLALLGKLNEELAECIAAASRCIIQGLDAEHPETGKINREWFEDEIADVAAMMAHVSLQLDLDRMRMELRKKRKFDYKLPWFESFK